MTAIPVIDIAGLHNGSPLTQQAVAENIAAACRDTGFFYVLGHDVPADLTDAVLGEVRRFFDLPPADKLDVHHARSGCGRGYEPLGAQTLEEGMLPDLKESFLLGTDAPDEGSAGTAKIDTYGLGRNLWPSALPGWRETMERYADVMCALSCTLMRGMALSLGLEAEHFATYCRAPATVLRLLHYPEQPANAPPGEQGCGAHTDWGGLTFLLQDDAGGLQVKSDDGWIDAAPLPGSFVVNIGDMLARWTNERYRSTVHRVINRSGRRRFSVAFFFEGALDHDVICLPACLDPGELPRYPPTTVGRHLTEMYRRTYGKGPAD